MRLEGTVGPQVLQDGALADVRLGRLGATIVTELHGKYLEETLRGNVFHACSDTGVIFPAVAATAANVFTLYNPAGSGKNLSLVSFDMVATTINATMVTGAYALMVNTNVVAAAITVGTAITPIPGLVGTNNQPVAKVFRGATLPAAPTIFWPFANKVTGGAATAIPIIGIPGFHIEFDGLVVLTPGTAITPQIVGTADTTNLTVICAARWEELPV